MRNAKHSFLCNIYIIIPTFHVKIPKVYIIGFPAIFVTSSFNFINFQFNFVRSSLLRSNLKFNFVKLSFTFVFCQSNVKIQHSNSSVVTEIDSVAKRVTNARIKFVILSNKFIILSFKFVKCYWAFTSRRRFWLKLWRKWMPMDEIAFAVSCAATVTDEFELQLTKTGD